MAQVAKLEEQGAQKPFELDKALIKGFQNDCTDLHIRAHDFPIFRLHGRLIRDKAYPIFTPEETRKISLSMINDYQKNNLEENGDCDLAYEIPGVSRFRVNIFYERDNLAIALRTIPQRVPKIEELGIPIDVSKELSMLPRGIVLVTGPTGSGKSTTLAAMINFINENRPCNIITIEDPIEYKHVSKMAMVSQREIGSDTISFARALRSALRQDPDVILLGEMRDLETISTALTAAETGHLVFATLHTNSAVSSVDRIIDVFPSHQQAQIRLQLSMALQGILSQTLLPRTRETGGGRVVAVETLVATHGIRNMIREAKTHQLPTALESGSKWGMKTLDMDLKRLVQEGKLTLETAMSVCHHPDEFRSSLGIRSGKNS
ncbi:MAG TPA: type IV pilus twitching motility protein PilT [Firmicutes bacterium]|nr:type IV pilus twitching motility protein PilT [Bacillota bacterium]